MAPAGRDSGKHGMHNGEVDRAGTSVPDASLTHVQAGQLAAMGIQDIGAHHVQGDVVFWLAQATSAVPSRL